MRLPNDFVRYIKKKKKNVLNLNNIFVDNVIAGLLFSGVFKIWFIGLLKKKKYNNL